ncbi:MAG: transposase [Pseudomonadota bacterium]
MKRSRCSEEQIMAILKEQESGMPTVDVCRWHGTNAATFYNYKSKYGSLEVSDARRLRTLDQKNARLKELLADHILVDAILREAKTQQFSRPTKSATRWPILKERLR